jgi:hypothetical protein
MRILTRLSKGTLFVGGGSGFRMARLIASFIVASVNFSRPGLKPAIALSDVRLQSGIMKAHHYIEEEILCTWGCARRISNFPGW